MPKGGPSASSKIRADVVDEGRRLVELAGAQSVPLRLLGGVAVNVRAPGELPEPLRRTYKDLDFATSRKAGGATARLLRDAGYEPHVAFNAMNSKERMLFFDEGNARQVDVFVGSFRMCHEIPLEERLDVHTDTVPLAELLLTKLQIIELNEKDIRDTVALFYSHEVTDDDSGLNLCRVAELCAADWGLHRTITANLETVRRHIDRYPIETGSEVDRRIAYLEECIEAEPKSRAWRLRAKVGDRKRWYELPEEV
jgi:hypothetical protein